MSNIIDLSSEQMLMDTDGQSYLLHNDPNQNSLTVNVAKNDSLMELHDAPSAFDTFKFILSANVNNNQNGLTIEEEQKLIQLGQNYKDGQILNLITYFAASYNIYIHFIAFRQGKFQIVNEYNFLVEFERKQAFIVLNGNLTVCGPLSSVASNGRQAVFPFDDIRVTLEVNKYIEQLNRIDPRSFRVTQENRNSSNDMGANDISVLPTESNTGILDLPSTTMEIHTSSDKIAKKIIKTTDPVPVLSTIPLSIREPDTSVHTSASNASARVGEADQIPSHPQASSSTHLSNTTQVSRTSHAPALTSTTYSKPEIEVQPKSDWKLRYAKDLILSDRKKSKVKRKTRKQIKKERMVKFIELLHGVGDKGSQIKVKVPLAMTERKMYLAVTVRTVNNRYHSSKVLVPKGTKVNAERFNRENRLNYLEFDGCDSKDFFDHDTRNVYLEITPQEHTRRFKYVPVYMFNLYQNQQLTKDMIEREQLRKCKLAFWLCVKENGNYKSISLESLSQTITEKKKENQYDPP